jgi:hypothetical protein
MIGLGFVAVGLLWLAFSVFLAVRLPSWVGITNPIWRWGTSAVVLILLLIGPFVDHIVGMRQFERLCTEETGLQVFSGAVSTTRARESSSAREHVGGTAIVISRSVSTITDLDTGEVVARYKNFSTRGGVIGRLPMLGGEHVCSVDGPRHPMHDQYKALKNQTRLTYGDAK